MNLGDPRTLSVLYSEPVEAASALDPANYALDGGVIVQSAQFAGDTRTVALRTSTLDSGVDYTVTVSGVRDRASTPNTAAPRHSLHVPDRGIAISHRSAPPGGGNRLAPRTAAGE